MSKSIDFKVEYGIVGGSMSKKEIFKAKNITRLLDAFPKHIKRKWIKVSWNESGIEKELARSEYEKQ